MVNFLATSEHGRMMTYHGNVDGKHGFDLRFVNGSIGVTIVNGLGKEVPNQERYTKEKEEIINAFKNRNNERNEAEKK